MITDSFTWVLKDLGTNDSTLAIGYSCYEGANHMFKFCRTPFHADVFTSYSWSVNVCGEKKWLILPPGEEIKLKDKFGNLPYDISFLEDNTNNNTDENDSNNNASNMNTKLFVIYQKPGDAIFIPSGWHHQVHNMVRNSNMDKL